MRLFLRQRDFVRRVRARTSVPASRDSARRSRIFQHHDARWPCPLGADEIAAVRRRNRFDEPSLLGFAAFRPLARCRRPHHPVLVHRLAPLLHASFRPDSRPARARVEQISTTERDVRKGWRRGWESNPRIKVLQTSPLPLGYRASICLPYRVPPAKSSTLTSAGNGWQACTILTLFMRVRLRSDVECG